MSIEKDHYPRVILGSTIPGDLYTAYFQESEIVKPKIIRCGFFDEKYMRKGKVKTQFYYDQWLLLSRQYDHIDMEKRGDGHFYQIQEFVLENGKYRIAD